MELFKSPSPAHYDNFKAFFDRGKQRSFTIGRKFKKSDVNSGPGPAGYNTRGKTFSTNGGTGSSTG